MITRTQRFSFHLTPEMALSELHIASKTQITLTPGETLELLDYLSEHRNDIISKARQAQERKPATWGEPPEGYVE